VPALAIAGVVLVALLAVCCGGGAFYLSTRGRPVADPSTAPAVVPAPSAASPTARASRTSPAPLTGAACIIGRWRETSGQSDASIDGVTVRLAWSGGIQTYRSDGVNIIELGDGVAKTGTHSGSTYTVTSSGTITYHYQVVGDQIRYSDVQAQGTTTWLRDGQQIDQQQLTGTLGADTFTCAGDTFIQYGDTYTIELTRVT
jgi:hypothetical protein